MGSEYKEMHYSLCRMFLFFQKKFNVGETQTLGPLLAL